MPELWKNGRWSGELEAFDPAGGVVSLWQSAITHRGADRKPTFFSGIARDMTEMKHGADVGAASRTTASMRWSRRART